jgi:pimeloyl-ACP methyl ester carboxylesterase
MSSPLESNAPQEAAWRDAVTRKRATSADGTGIAYDVVGRGPRTLLVANGLGGRLYAWQPLIDAFWSDFKIITWDYRGLFDSETPASHRRMSVAHHVEDAIALLEAERVERAVFVGWSMGVQVSLDAAATHPARCAGLVLLNGTYGQVFQTGFQPFFSLRAMPKHLHATVEWLHEHPEAADVIARVTRLFEAPTRLMLRFTSGRRASELSPMLRRYMEDVTGPSFRNYLRLFQELDAHSVYHVLPGITAPALVISGLLDALTPSFQSAEIARRMPDAEHIPLISGHFSMVERPEIVIPAMTEFLRRRATF